MDGMPQTYRVVERPGAMPDSDEAGEVFASLLGTEADRLLASPVVLPPGTRVGAHRHSSALAAGVVSGAITFVFGADGTGRVELGPGDYVWLGEGVMHDEETSDGVEFVVASTEPFETLTD